MGFGHAGWEGQDLAVSLSSATWHPGVAGQECSKNTLLKEKHNKSEQKTKTNQQISKQTKKSKIKNKFKNKPKPTTKTSQTNKKKP